MGFTISCRQTLLESFNIKLCRGKWVHNGEVAGKKTLNHPAQVTTVSPIISMLLKIIIRNVLILTFLII